MARFTDYTEWTAKKPDAEAQNRRERVRDDSLDSLFDDPEIRQRVGEFISRAARHAGKGF